MMHPGRGHSQVRESSWLCLDPACVRACVRMSSPGWNNHACLQLVLRLVI